MVALVTTTAAAAAPLSQPARRASLVTAMERAVEQVSPMAAPTALKLVWDGADVDGDGRADFANPTGNEPRLHDAYGDGEFGARRDGGSRRHEGVDYTARAGQPVAAPMSGYVTKIGYAYSGDQSLQFVEITNPALNYAARVFYVNPKVEVGDAVAIGRPIGTAHSLQRKYPGGMTDHVHLEIIDRSGDRIDATRMITAEYRPASMSVAAAD
ncbi:MAG: M23 family metallopeptidase [Alphaproteobacteria bacterium]|nr:M23 family metallopeptidase [Alphaproteobacteria bacterium]MBU1516132.1 M23 family metallopeptidase [Alphaproteobacteria bacterium]MBU2092653.1 M23 family metallopeptidase [Alphaproteobacteria bacterium]MBU2150105.1 M23 family metallopeptidase [Alphaproteobacteria bacterium]MBU2308450.1 M23 family metallopeptidase [Alphaproteobacteria bacterium]